MKATLTHLITLAKIFIEKPSVNINFGLSNVWIQSILDKKENKYWEILEPAVDKISQGGKSSERFLEKLGEQWKQIKNKALTEMTEEEQGVFQLSQLVQKANEYSAEPADLSNQSIDRADRPDKIIFSSIFQEEGMVLNQEELEQCLQNLKPYALPVAIRHEQFCGIIWWNAPEKKWILSINDYTQRPQVSHSVQKVKESGQSRKKNLQVSLSSELFRAFHLDPTHSILFIVTCFVPLHTENSFPLRAELKKMLLPAYDLSQKAPLLSKETYRRLLQLICAQGDVNELEVLLAYATDKREEVNAELKNRTPLHYAALSLNTRIMEVLINYGAVFKNENREVASPLDYAVKVNNLAAARMLLAHFGNKDINRDCVHRHAPLFTAIYFGHEDMVRLLLEHDADVHLIWRGEQPIHLAAKRRNVNIMRMLLEHRPISSPPIDLSIRTKEGDSVVHLACKVGDIEMVKFLIAYEPALLRQREATQNLLPIHVAAGTDKTELTKMLLPFQSELMQQSADTNLPADFLLLFIACSRGNKELMAFLLAEERFQQYICFENPDAGYVQPLETLPAGVTPEVFSWVLTQINLEICNQPLLKAYLLKVETKLRSYITNLLRDRQSVNHPVSMLKILNEYLKKNTFLKNHSSRDQTALPAKVSIHLYDILKWGRTLGYYKDLQETQLIALAKTLNEELKKGLVNAWIRAVLRHQITDYFEQLIHIQSSPSDPAALKPFYEEVFLKITQSEAASQWLQGDLDGNSPFFQIARDKMYGLKKEDLSQLLLQLADLCQKENQPFPVMISYEEESTVHITYHPGKGWYYYHLQLNSLLQGYELLQEAHDSQSIDLLTEEILHLLKVNRSATYNIFHVVLLAPSGLEPRKKEELGYTLLPMYSITKQHASLQTKKGVGLLYFACLFEQTIEAFRLIEEGADVNQKAASQKELSPLHLACISGATNIVAMLLANEADIHRRIDGILPIHSACTNGHGDIVQALVAEDPTLVDAPIEKPDSCDTPLMIVCQIKEEHEELFDFLMTKSSREKRSRDGHLPIHYAVIHNHLSYVKKFLSAYSFSSADDRKLLDLACLYAREEMVSYLLTEYKERFVKHINGNPQRNIENEFAFSLACAAGSPGMVKLLLDNNADLSKTDGNYSSLSLACINERLEIIKILLDVGVDLEELVNNVTALDNACIHRKMEVVKLLLAHGASACALKHKKNMEETTLFLTYAHNDTTEIFKLLLVAVDWNKAKKTLESLKKHIEKELEKNPSDKKANAYLQVLANFTCHKQILVKQFATGAAGFFTRSAHIKQLEPFYKACVDLNLEDITTLSSRWPNLIKMANEKEDVFYSLCSRACAHPLRPSRAPEERERLMQIIHFFLEHPTGASWINKKHAMTGRTVLHVACAFQDKEVTKLLLSYGADPDKKDKKGCTPRQLVETSSKEFKALFFEKLNMGPSIF